MRTLIATLIALMLFAATPVVAGDWEDGYAAYQARDYQKAFQLLKPLAERGVAKAQQTLGFMYDRGYGLPRDHAKAAYWFTKAAKQGKKGAQISLGMMHLSGKGVPEDVVLSYAWSSVADAQGAAVGGIGKRIAAESMSPAQIAEGQKLSRELWEKYVVPFQKE